MQRKVDKDVKLFKEFFKLDNCEYRHMSPLVMENGYTKKYLDGEKSDSDQLRVIKNGFEDIT